MNFFLDAYKMTGVWEPLDCFRMGTDYSLELSVPSIIFWREERGWRWVHNGACLCDEAFTEIPELCSGRGFGLVNVSMCWNDGHPNFMVTEALVFRILQDFTLYKSSSGCSFISFIINQYTHVIVPLSSLSHYSKLWNLRKELWEVLIYSQLFDRSAGDNLGLATGVWCVCVWGGRCTVLWGWAHNLWRETVNFR